VKFINLSKISSVSFSVVIIIIIIIILFLLLLPAGLPDGQRCRYCFYSQVGAIFRFLPIVAKLLTGPKKHWGGVK